tara:strand:+ start:835 stop:1185 length:351 start_codon:yes stop_codon:yes gene_type:complete
LGLPVIDYLLTFPLISWIVCTIFAVGFVNAMNMADGANGLVPGITFAAFFVFACETGRMLEVGYMSACALYLVFNVISGRFSLVIWGLTDWVRLLRSMGFGLFLKEQSQHPFWLVF